MKRSEFAGEHGEAAARAAEKAGATWEAEGPVLPKEARDAIHLAAMEATDRGKSWGDTVGLIARLCVRLAPLWPPAQPEPVGAHRFEVRKDAHGNASAIRDATTGLDALHLYTGSERNRQRLPEILALLNREPAWPAPRRAVPGDPASQPASAKALLWQRDRWYAATGVIAGWWLPDPPPPPEE